MAKTSGATGRWEGVVYPGGGLEIYEVGEERDLYITGFDDGKDGRLVLAAVNACKSINPENPEYVAEKIGEMYGALRQMVGLTCLSARYAVLNRGIGLKTEEGIELLNARQILTDIERGE